MKTLKTATVHNPPQRKKNIFRFYPVSVLLLLLCVSCAHMPYEQTDVFKLAYKNEIADIDKRLETGMFCFRNFEYTSAERNFRIAAGAAMKIGYGTAACAGFNDLGLLHLKFSNISAARSNFTSALAVARSNKFKALECEALNGLGVLSLAQHDTAQALDYFRKADQSAISPLLRHALKNNIAWADFLNGSKNGALSGFRTVLSFAERNGYHDLAVKAGLHIGDVCLSSGQTAEAEQAYKKALDTAMFWEDRPGAVECLKHLASLYEGRGDIAQALMNMKAVLEIHTTARAIQLLDDDKAEIDRLEALSGTR
jgi:tetratricopeptide (TPR) repeat protein